MDRKIANINGNQYLVPTATRLSKTENWSCAAEEWSIYSTNTKTVKMDDEKFLSLKKLSDKDFIDAIKPVYKQMMEVISINKNIKDRRLNWESNEEYIKNMEMVHKEYFDNVSYAINILKRQLDRIVDVFIQYDIYEPYKTYQLQFPETSNEIRKPNIFMRIINFFR